MLLGILSLWVVIPACKQRSTDHSKLEETQEVQRKRQEDKLIELIKAGDAEAVKQLLDTGFSPNIGDQSAAEFLYIAALKKRKDIVEYLIQAGADVNTKDDHHLPVLMKLCTIGGGDKDGLEIVRLLIQNGADVNFRNDNEETVLSRTIEIQNIEIARLLIDAGADVNARDREGTTVLMEAAFEYKGAKLLVDRGADVNARDNHGQTALMIVSIARSPRIIKLLLDHGADVNAQDNNGETALEGAYLSGCLDVVNVLKRAGAKD
jgi:ankyrin repeat protein